MPTDESVEYRDAFGDLITIERSGATIRIIASNTGVEKDCSGCGFGDVETQLEFDITTARAVSDAIAMMARNAETDHD
jgi:hypothetical protein